MLRSFIWNVKSTTHHVKQPLSRFTLVKCTHFVFLEWIFASGISYLNYRELDISSENLIEKFIYESRISNSTGECMLKFSYVNNTEFLIHAGKYVHIYPYGKHTIFHISWANIYSWIFKHEIQISYIM